MRNTEKYGFHLMDGSDPLSPQPINENTEKTEALLADAMGLNLIREVTADSDIAYPNSLDMDVSDLDLTVYHHLYVDAFQTLYTAGSTYTKLQVNGITSGYTRYGYTGNYSTHGCLLDMILDKAGGDAYNQRAVLPVYRRGDFTIRCWPDCPNSYYCVAPAGTTIATLHTINLRGLNVAIPAGTVLRLWGAR